MTENSQIEIPLSRVKLAKLLFFCVMFLIAGVWMIVSDPQTSNPLFNNIFVKSLVSYGAAIMGLLGIYFYSRKMLDKKPGLVLNEQGIYDNTSAFRFGLIPWSDISQIYERKVQTSIASKQQFVTISLIQPEKYISRETNVLKRKVLQANARSYGSPVHISTNGLRINHKELLGLVKSYFDKYRQTI